MGEIQLDLFAPPVSRADAILARIGAEWYAAFDSAWEEAKAQGLGHAYRVNAAHEASVAFYARHLGITFAESEAMKSRDKKSKLLALRLADEENMK